jgi:transcriptional regulator with XRE-family HTH domain
MVALEPPIPPVRRAALDGVDRLRHLELGRRDKRLSLQAVGEHPQVRMDPNFISLIERGMGIPTADQCERLAEFLGVPADTLLDPVPVVAPTATAVTETVGD